jgi:acyl-CoA synthetase (AMP-forming)/AMP-acid ligase II
VTGFWSLVEWRAGRSAGDEMLVDERGRRLTFGGFMRRASLAAAGLAGLGVGRGTPVTWQMPTTVEALLLTAALARLGAVQNPVMPACGARDLEFMVRQTGARFLIVSEGDAERVSAARGLARTVDGLALLTVNEHLPEGPTPPPASQEGGSPVRWIFYTSGTSSRPKGARHTDASVLASARAMGDRLRCTASDRVGMAFPVAHIGGCGTWLAACLLYGCTLVLDSAFSPSRTIPLQQRENVTLAGSGTVFIDAFLAAQEARPGQALLPKLRAMTAGAAPKPATLHERVKKSLGGVGVLSGYGMTEAPILTMSGPDDPDEVLATCEGRPTTGVDLRVVGVDGTILGRGEEGELRVKGPQVMRGYVDARLDADAFDDDGYLRTGDLGRIERHGGVVITGRLKDVIIRKGENISARAVEEELLRHPAVAQVAVIGVPDAERGEMACAVVVPADGAELTGLPDVTAFLAESELPVRQWPERLELVDDLPRNSTGKVLKAQLRERFGRAS